MTLDEAITECNSHIFEEDSDSKWYTQLYKWLIRLRNLEDAVALNSYHNVDKDNLDTLPTDTDRKIICYTDGHYPETYLIGYYGLSWFDNNPCWRFDSHTEIKWEYILAWKYLREYGEYVDV